MKIRVACAVLLIFSIYFLNSSSSASEFSLTVDSRSSDSCRVPDRIAVNPFSNRAIVLSEKDSSVLIMDLSTKEVLSRVKVGKRPRGVAVAGRLNLALVSSSEDDSVSVLDLNSYEITKTISVGRCPEGIAINDHTYVAVVCNRLDDTISVIDLTSYAVINTFTIGGSPAAISIDPELDIALIQGLESNDIKVVDMNTYQITRTISVGRPRGVIVNPRNHKAAIMSGLERSIVTVDLTDWRIRKSQLPGTPLAFAMDPVGNRSLTICENDENLYLIDLDSGRVEGSLVLDRELKGVAVNPFTNLAAVVAEASSDVSVIQLPYPVPQITSVEPVDLLRGGEPTRLSIRGSGFTRSSTVSILPSLNLPVRFIDERRLQVFLPESVLETAGIREIVLRNPGPEGGMSAPFTIRVRNPVVSLLKIDPESEFAGATGMTVRIHGTGFLDGTIVLIKGSPRRFHLLNSNQIEVDLTSVDLEAGRYLELEALNPSPGGGKSIPLTFTVLNPIPMVIAATPSAIPREEEDFKFDVMGENFLKTSRVRVNGQEFESDFVNGRQLAVTIPSSFINPNTSYSLEVMNPFPGGGESDSLVLAIEPRREMEPQLIARP